MLNIECISVNNVLVNGVGEAGIACFKENLLLLKLFFFQAPPVCMKSCDKEKGHMHLSLSSNYYLLISCYPSWHPCSCRQIQWQHLCLRHDAVQCSLGIWGISKCWSIKNITNMIWQLRNIVQYMSNHQLIASKTVEHLMMTKILSCQTYGIKCTEASLKLNWAGTH